MPAPTRAPRRLERLAIACLKTEAEDSRLGDLSEQYVHTYERISKYLGDTPASHLAADIHYLFSAASVALFTRTVDPAVPVAEPAPASTVVVALKERTTTMPRITARKLVLPALLLVGSAFLISGAVNAWKTWRETEALMIGLQQQKAETAATQISQQIATLQNQIAWTAMMVERGGSAVPPMQRRLEYLRLFRQVPAVTELAHLNAEGKEILRASRLRMDTLDSGADFSADARFTEAVKHGKYAGPLYFNKRSEPMMSLAIAHSGSAAGVTVAEVNARGLWDIVDRVKVGETGYAHVVDETGRPIGSRALPQAAVLSAHATVPATRWKVFVDLPIAEARAPLWSAAIRAASLLALGLLAIFLASLATVRRAPPAHQAS